MPALADRCTGGPCVGYYLTNPPPTSLPLLSYENQLTTTIKVVLTEIKPDVMFN